MIKTIRLKLYPDCYPYLDIGAIESNQVWNYCNEVSMNAADRNKRANTKLLSGFDLNNLSAGSSKYFEKIGSQTIQRVCCEFAKKRKQFKKFKLKWRKSFGTNRSLGWIPFKGGDIKRKGNALRYMGKTFRVFNREYLGNYKFKDGCFSQNSLGEWFICIPVEVPDTDVPAPNEAVGIDLGIKTAVTTSDGEVFESRFYRNAEKKIAQAQRRGHKKQAKRLNKKVKYQRVDAIHKFTRGVVNSYQNIFIGDVNSTWLAQTNMAKAVYDSAWFLLKTQLLYKGQSAGRRVEVVSEKYTTQDCSSCGSRSGPKGRRQLDVRFWKCVACGEEHDRDVNAARNILQVASGSGRPSAGTRESPRVTCIDDRFS